MTEREGGGRTDGEPDHGDPAPGVLVVDDDPSIQGVLAEALADEGYARRTSSTAPTGMTDRATKPQNSGE
jgi:CheY-like chemotaxis protein